MSADLHPATSIGNDMAPPSLGGGWVGVGDAIVDVPLLGPGSPAPDLSPPGRRTSGAELAVKLPRILVLGFGNPGRQDDGLGPAVSTQIAALGWPHVTAYDKYQLNIEDALDVAAHDVVWFVDATKTGASPFAVEPIEAAASAEFTSHLLRPEAVLALADRYYDARPQAFLLGVRGYAFEFIEALTPEANDNLARAVAMLTGLLRGRGEAALA